MCVCVCERERENERERTRDRWIEEERCDAIQFGVTKKEDDEKQKILRDEKHKVDYLGLP